MTVRQAGGALPTHLGEAGLDFRKAVASEQGQCIGASAEAVGDTGKEAAERSPEVDEEVSMTMDENRFWFPAAISCRSPSDFGPSAAKALKGCSRVLVETSSTLPVQTGKRGTDVVSWRYAPAVRWPGSDASNDRRKPGQTVSNPTTWGGSAKAGTACSRTSPRRVPTPFSTWIMWTLAPPDSMSSKRKLAENRWKEPAARIAMVVSTGSPCSGVALIVRPLDSLCRNVLCKG
mgnify:CR=1 FL=1